MPARKAGSRTADQLPSLLFVLRCAFCHKTSHPAVLMMQIGRRGNYLCIVIRRGTKIERGIVESCKVLC